MKKLFLYRTIMLLIIIVFIGGCASTNVQSTSVQGTTVVRKKNIEALYKEAAYGRRSIDPKQRSWHEQGLMNMNGTQQKHI